jgi:hypothetical protein
MTTLLFYKKPTALNAQLHSDLNFVNDASDYGFANATNSVILAGVEFIEACKEYPIVFTRASNGVAVPAAVLGVSNEQNLFVNEAGEWDARYIPAFVRRYPFVLAESGEAGKETLTVCYDAESPNFSTKRGEPLFDKKGEPTELLGNTMKLLQAYHEQTKRTAEMMALVDEHQLLRPMNMRMELNRGDQFALEGLLIIDESKLADLPAEVTQKLQKEGFMGWIYAHLISLSNFARLLDRVNEQTTGNAALDKAADKPTNETKTSRTKR